LLYNTTGNAAGGVDGWSVVLNAKVYYRVNIKCSSERGRDWSSVTSQYCVVACVLVRSRGMLEYSRYSAQFKVGTVI